MSMHTIRLLFAVGVSWCGLLPTAQAQWAVIDAPAIVQLVQEVQAMEQQVQTARDQLTQARQALQTMTGDRGMAALLSGTQRNYLPSTWSQLTDGARGGPGSAPGLASQVHLAIAANAILSPSHLATLSAAEQRQLAAGREASALQQALAQAALYNVSGRFAAIQALVDAITGAVDQKAILDLQARISAELAMLQNEQTKLQVLRQATGAQDAVNRQQQREQIIAGHGVFVSRFEPAP